MEHNRKRIYRISVALRNSSLPQENHIILYIIHTPQPVFYQSHTAHTNIVKNVLYTIEIRIVSHKMEVILYYI